jgi:Mg2+ and Co2+ transporter CorA
MIINSFQIDDELQLTPLAPERAAQVVQNKDARVWIDVQTAEPAEIEAWLDTLGIIGLPRRLCLEASDRSGFYPLKKEIFLVIPVLANIVSAREGLPCPSLPGEPAAVFSPQDPL